MMVMVRIKRLRTTKRIVSRGGEKKYSIEKNKSSSDLDEAEAKETLIKRKTSAGIHAHSNATNSQIFSLI